MTATLLESTSTPAHLSTCVVVLRDTKTDIRSLCHAPAPNRASFQSDCGQSGTRDLCDLHVRSVAQGMVMCIHGTHVVDLVSVERDGGAV